MFEYDPRYYRKARLSSDSPLKAREFRPEDFTPEGESLTADPDAFTPKSPYFDDFSDQASVFRLQADPTGGDLSLDDLFKPFDLDSEHQTKAEPEPYEDLYKPGVEDFHYEDLDTRPPEVIQTLARAREEADSIVKSAQVQAETLMKKARNEAAALIAELKRREEQKQEAARQAIENLRQSVRERLAEAENTAKAAESERREAEERKAEAEQRLLDASERIAGLDDEKLRLEAEHAARLEEMENSKEAVMAEARAAAYEEGRTQGLAEGRESGRAEAIENFKQETAGFTSMAEKLERLYEDLWQTNSPLMIKMAIEAAEHIVNKELSTSEDLAAHAFRAAVDYLSQAHQVTVYVRPQDIAQLELAKAENRARLGALVKVSFKEDETLGPGDLIIESDVGRLDATVKHRTSQMMNVLRKAFEDQYGPAGEQPKAARAGDDSDPGDIVDVEFESDSGREGASPANRSEDTQEDDPHDEQQ